MIRLPCCCLTRLVEIVSFSAWFGLQWSCQIYVLQYFVLVKDFTFSIGRYSTRPISISCWLILFFRPIYVYFLSNALSSSPPLVTHNLGVTWQALFILRHCRACRRADIEKLHVTCSEFSVSFFSLASNHSRRTGFHAIHQTQLNTRRPFCGQFAYWCRCFRLWYGHLRTHTPYMMIPYFLWCILTSSILSVSCDTSHDRYWDMPKLCSTMISIYLEIIAWYICR